DIREMLSQMNSKEIQQLRNDWLQHGYGPPLDEALLQDKNLPESTREVLKVYLKGIDQRDKDDPQFSDTITLANLALKQKDLGLLEETFGEGKASDAARRYFLDRGGEQVIRDIWAPEPGVNYNPRISGRDVRQALDYVKYGHLSLETQAYANDGIFSSHEGAIKDAAKSMTQHERDLYFEGRKLVQEYVVMTRKLSPQETDAYNYYVATNNALRAEGNATYVAEWE